MFRGIEANRCLCCVEGSGPRILGRCRCIGPPGDRPNGVGRSEVDFRLTRSRGPFALSLGIDVRVFESVSRVKFGHVGVHSLRLKLRPRSQYQRIARQAS
jgi:hypothetical protein